MAPRRKRASGKLAIAVSLVLHLIAVSCVGFLAAREGVLGQSLKEFAVSLVPADPTPKASEVEPAPVLEEESHDPVENPQADSAEAPVAPPSVSEPAGAMPAPPASGAGAPSVAPPAVIGPSFRFSDGATLVQTSSDPSVIYKGLVEYTLRSNWKRPESVDDSGFAGAVEVEIGKAGTVRMKGWKSRSGHADWDRSVEAVFRDIGPMRRPPPNGFPQTVVVRFDTTSRSEELSH